MDTNRAIADFKRRVDFAIRVISDGSTTTRQFDSCFEMYDGDYVVAAIMRRAAHNPRLHEALYRRDGNWASSMPEWELCAVSLAHVADKDMATTAIAYAAAKEAIIRGRYDTAIQETSVTTQPALFAF
jgi:hypothetical protein